MRDKKTGRKTADHTITPDDRVIDQAEEQKDLAEEYLGDFVGDTSSITQHEMVCIQCGKGGGTLVRVGGGKGSEATYRHKGVHGCDMIASKPFNRGTRRRLGMS